MVTRQDIISHLQEGWSNRIDLRLFNEYFSPSVLLYFDKTMTRYNSNFAVDILRRMVTWNGQYQLLISPLLEWTGD